MNFGLHLSVVAAAAQLTLVAVGAFVSRAPGWARWRIFLALALTAALYSLNDAIWASPFVDDAQRLWIVRLNFFWATLHAVAWLSYTRARPDAPLRSLSLPLQLLAAGLVVAGVLALVPGLITTDELYTIELDWLGLSYRQAEVTIWGELLSAVTLLALLIPLATYVGEVRRAVPGARLRVVGFVIFFLCVAEEALVAARVLEFLFLADVGFLAIVAVALVEAIGRVIDDGRALQAASDELGRQVARRTEERDEAREALANAERLAALGQLAGGVAHQINNPLTFVKGNLDYLREELEADRRPPDAREVLADALAGVERMRRVVADLQAFTRPSTERLEALPLEEVVAAAIVRCRPLLRVAPHPSIALAAGLRVRADRERLEQVCVNLLTNAAQAIAEAGPTAPRLELRSARVGAEVELCISDNGAGMAAATLARLGQPYFSTRAPHEASGLGLFVARGLLTSMGGRLQFESAPGEGTTARLLLPSADPAGESALNPGSDMTPAAEDAAAPAARRT